MVFSLSTSLRAEMNGPRPPPHKAWTLEQDVHQKEKQLSERGSASRARAKEATGVSRLDLTCSRREPSCYLLPRFLANSRWMSSVCRIPRGRG